MLTHAGKIAHEQALKKAELEYEKFHRAQLAEPTPEEKHFEEAVKRLKTLPLSKEKRGKG